MYDGTGEGGSRRKRKTSTEMQAEVRLEYDTIMAFLLKEVLMKTIPPDDVRAIFHVLGQVIY